MAINSVGIIGTGTMGLGIAHVCAQAGRQVVAVKATPGPTDKARSSLDKSLGRIVERGKMTAADKDAILGRITFTADESAVAPCDLVIESIIEDIAAAFSHHAAALPPQRLHHPQTHGWAAC